MEQCVCRGGRATVFVHLPSVYLGFEGVVSQSQSFKGEVHVCFIISIIGLGGCLHSCHAHFGSPVRRVASGEYVGALHIDGIVGLNRVAESATSSQCSFREDLFLKLDGGYCCSEYGHGCRLSHHDFICCFY